MDDEEGRAHLGEVAQRREGGARDGVCRRAFGAQNSGRHVGGELRARCNQKPSAVVKSHLKHYRRFVGGELRAQRRQSMAGNGWRMGVPPAKQPGHSMALDGNQWQSPARGARALDGNQWQSPVRGARALNGNGWQSMAITCERSQSTQWQWMAINGNGWQSPARGARARPPHDPEGARQRRQGR